MSIDWTLPILLQSPNVVEHWTQRHKRNKKIHRILWAKWIKEKPGILLPCKVILTRLGPRLWDEINNIYSFKGLQDSITQMIFPEKARGQGDNDPRITWQYGQQKAKTKGVRIQIESS